MLVAYTTKNDSLHEWIHISANQYLYERVVCRVQCTESTELIFYPIQCRIASGGLFFNQLWARADFKNPWYRSRIHLLQACTWMLLSPRSYFLVPNHGLLTKCCYIFNLSSCHAYIVKARQYFYLLRHLCVLVDFKCRWYRSRIQIFLAMHLILWPEETWGCCYLGDCVIFFLVQTMIS